MQTKVKDKSKTTENHQNNENGMIVERRFTTAGEDPFDLFSCCLLYTSPSPRDA